ncbi:MAG: hypothetical protein KDI13_02200 [Alphaproteobacteria bacterium]|nr:hypothetical protein [Alphaproteobacteria bacterium]
MMTQKRFFLFALFSLLILAQMPSAFAARNNAATGENRDRQTYGGLFIRSIYAVRFIRDAQDPLKFVIRMISYGDVSGCAEIEPAYVEVKNQGPNIKVEVDDAKLHLKNQDPRYSNYDCQSEMNRAYFDLPLDRDTLLNKKIKKIVLKSKDYGTFSDSDVDIDEERLLLTVHSQWGETTMTYWFYPANTVILYATGVKQGQNVKSMIRDLGEQNGLIPLQDTLTEFNQPRLMSDTYYFTDPSGKFLQQVKDSGDAVKVGEIAPTRVVFDTNGPKDEPYQVDVFVKQPGEND